MAGGHDAAERRLVRGRWNSRRRPRSTPCRSCRQRDSRRARRGCPSRRPATRRSPSSAAVRCATRASITRSPGTGPSTRRSVTGRRMPPAPSDRVRARELQRRHRQSVAVGDRRLLDLSPVRCVVRASPPTRRGSRCRSLRRSRTRAACRASTCGASVIAILVMPTLLDFAMHRGQRDRAEVVLVGDRS